MADKDLHHTTEFESGVHHPQFAAIMVQDWAINGLGVPEETAFYVVWFCFILGGWKALVSSTNPDGRYYEVTYDKDKGVAYVDTYLKTHNHIAEITD